MFTLFHLKNSKPVTAAEHDALCRVLDDYARTPAGVWLANLPYHRFTYKYCPAMADSDVMGCWLPMYETTVFLRPCDVPGPDSVTWIETIAASVIHELRHAWQFKRAPLLYILACLPMIRDLTIERDAKQITEKADKIVENVLAWRQGQAFERTRGTCENQSSR